MRPVADGEPPLGRVLMPLAAGMLAGGAIASRADAAGIALIVGSASLALLVVVLIVEREARTIALTFALACGATIAVTELRAAPLAADHVKGYAELLRARSAGSSGGPSAVEGLVVASSPRTEARLLTVRTDHVRSAVVDAPATGLLGVTIAHARHAWPVGARVRVVGRLRQPHNFGNPGGYDVARALARRGILATMFLWNEDAIVLLADPATGVASVLARLRDRIASRVAANVPEPASGFVVAVLSGLDGSVGDDTRRVLARTGLAHATSVSGFHFAVVAGAALLVAGACLRRSERVLLRGDVWKLAALVGLVPVSIYGAIAGESIPAVRSIVMYAVVLGALLVERPPDGLRALAAAAVVLAVAVPDVVADISFELSFVSVAALIMVARRQRRGGRDARAGWSRARRALHTWVVEPLGVSVAATLATAPLTAWHFQQVSLIAPIANLLALPFLGPGTLLPGLAALPLLAITPRIAMRCSRLPAHPRAWASALRAPARRCRTRRWRRRCRPHSSSVCYGGCSCRSSPPRRAREPPTISGRTVERRAVALAAYWSRSSRSSRSSTAGTGLGNAMRTRACVRPFSRSGRATPRSSSCPAAV